MWIDTHCHFDVEEFAHDCTQIAADAYAQGVEGDCGHCLFSQILATTTIGLSAI